MLKKTLRKLSKKKVSSIQQTPNTTNEESNPFEMIDNGQEGDSQGAKSTKYLHNDSSTKQHNISQFSSMNHF